MKINKEKEFLAAMTKTLNAYDELIKNQLKVTLRNGQMPTIAEFALYTIKTALSVH
jgi:hypothetical protein